MRRMTADKVEIKKLPDNYSICGACGFALNYAVKIGHYCANERCDAPIDLTKADKLRVSLVKAILREHNER